MTRLYILLILLVYEMPCCSQNEHKIFLETDTLTFSIKRDGKFIGQEKYKIPIKLLKEPLATDGGSTVQFILYHKNGASTFPHSKFPLEESIPFTLQSPLKKIDSKLRFYPVGAEFDKNYMSKNSGTVSYEIPEVFELMNIILTLSSEFDNSNPNKSTQYFEDVEQHFKEYLEHPIFEKIASLDLSGNKEGNIYYELRENSYIFKFNDQDKIVSKDIYHHIQGGDSSTFKNQFTEFLPLIQDFAIKSRFRDFYTNHKKYYNKIVENEESLLKTKSMWDWLEREFPPIKISSYKIIFSPLIGGSHSTKRFDQFNVYKQQPFSEILMFINSSDEKYVDKYPEPAVQSALRSGVLFTEIDHNYVNPISMAYKNKIDDIFTEKIWTSEKASYYDNPLGVFQEYLTHALYSAYVKDTYSATVSDFAMNQRVELNKTKRGFIKFEEFNNELLRLKSSNKEKPIMVLIPELLKWCEKQKA